MGSLSAKHIKTPNRIKPATKRLEWVTRFGGGCDCIVSRILTMRAEREWRGDAFYATAFVGATCIYRSEETFDVESAKRECIRLGAIVARRLAKEYAEVAELLAGQGGVE